MSAPSLAFGFKGILPLFQNLKVVTVSFTRQDKSPRGSRLYANYEQYAQYDQYAQYSQYAQFVRYSQYTQYAPFS